MDNSGHLKHDGSNIPMMGSPPSSSPLSKSTSNSELSLKSREKLLNNEMRSFRNRGFHDGYDQGKQTTIQGSFDTGYKKAFEKNFVLSTLKGVANALKSSYNLRQQNQYNGEKHHHHCRKNQRPSSTNYSGSILRNTSNEGSPPSSIAQTPTSHSTTSTAPSSPKSSLRLSSSSSTSSSSSSSSNKRHHHRHRAGLSSSRLLAQKYHGSDGGRQSATSDGTGSTNDNNRNASDYTKRLSTISISGNGVGSSNFSSNNVFSLNISGNHLKLLESMKFDETSDIESLRNDLIKICRENRLEILAHYVSQIG